VTALAEDPEGCKEVFEGCREVWELLLVMSLRAPRLWVGCGSETERPERLMMLRAVY
jgi:hypothetical protein